MAICTYVSHRKHKQILLQDSSLEVSVIDYLKISRTIPNHD